MANLGALQNPGLAAFLASRQQATSDDNAQVAQASQLMQILGAAQQQQQRQAAMARDQAFRSELGALGPNATQEQLAQIAAKHGTPDAIMRTQQSSLDRRSALEAANLNRDAQREQAMEMQRERLQAAAELARQRSEDQRLSQAERNQARMDMIRLAASLRPPRAEPAPRNLQLTADAEGNQLIVNPDGTTTPLQAPGGVGGVRKSVGTDKPMTEFQGKAALYGTRSAQSDKVLKSLEDKINTSGLALGQATGVAGNFLMSSDQRRVDQAQRDFVNAVLRQESGAVISDAEFANAKKQYFPQPGDDPKVVSQKRANRQLAIQGFARMSGPKGAADIKAIIDEPLLPGVPNISPTPQQAGGVITAAPKKISSDAEFDALPSGTRFIGPDGKTRVKP